MGRLAGQRRKERDESERRGCCGAAAGWLALAAAVAAMRLSPGLADACARGVSRPGLLALNRLTAALPFPLAEPLALLLAWTCAARVAGILRNRLRRPALGQLAWILAAGYCLLWLAPALSAPPSRLPEPDTAGLARLCETLADALNEDARRTPLLSPEEALARAPGVAGLPGGAVKTARWPEWMHLAHASGMIVPWTGEALVDGADCPALIPFTAVHELLHLTGIADEGAANLAAWERCIAAGGAFAASARLWALRYGAGMLRPRDPDALHRALSRLNPVAAERWREAGGPISPGKSSYHTLAAWLAVRPGEAGCAR